ncbi:hypothetical protein ACFL1A_00270 [Patescibacteria group bacterium]
MKQKPKFPLVTGFALLLGVIGFSMLFHYWINYPDAKLWISDWGNIFFALGGTISMLFKRADLEFPWNNWDRLVKKPAASWIIGIVILFTGLAGIIGCILISIWGLIREFGCVYWLTFWIWFRIVLSIVKFKKRK